MVDAEHLKEIKINMEIDIKNIPGHIAIIMDGNGRWAKKRLLPRVLGHKEGVKAVERTLEAAGKLGVKYVTLYAFSTENWKRPKEEIDALMQLLVNAIDKYLERLLKDNVVLKVIGAYKDFPAPVVKKLEEAIKQTSRNDGVVLTFALNYSGRWEIVEAAQKIAKSVEDGDLSVQNISTDSVTNALATHFLPDPDLIIRTSGEYRTSNFLLWQSAYSEFYFTEQLWPDFNEESLKAAIVDYQSRERRFGDIK